MIANHAPAGQPKRRTAFQGPVGRLTVFRNPISIAHLAAFLLARVDLLLAEILDAEISIFVKTVFGLKTDVTARELAGVI
jgi:hypothetical protein